MTWAQYTLEELLILNYGKSLPENKRSSGEVPVYGSGGIAGFHKEHLVSGPGIIVGRKGSVGAVFFEKNDFFPIDTVYFVTHNQNETDLRFLYYLLKCLPLESLNSDAAVPGLNRNHAYSLKVRIPIFSVQQKIASLLSAYDDLIENNNRRIRLLEESARLLYQEWFVRLRFPGYEHTRIVERVPDGWEKKTLEELADVRMGQSPESKFYNSNGEGLPFHQGVSDFGERFVTSSVYSTALNRIAEAGDILCSVRAPVGRLNITIDKIVIGRGVAALRSKTGHQSFLYYQLKNHFFKEDMIGGGAIFASVTKKDLLAQAMLTPKDSFIRSFEDTSVNIDIQVQNLFLQNQKLKAARDLLLPRLISGEIQV